MADQCTGDEFVPLDRFADGSAQEPRGERQGGENYESAVVIPSLPAVLTGTNCGYLDDCGGFCGGWETLGPDVVYEYTATEDTSITIDTCGSSLNTAVFVRDEWLNTISCNDDRWEPEGSDCEPHTSWIVRAPVAAGATYYIVIAGMSAICDDYVVSVEEYVPCNIECSGVEEGEPPLHDGYLDEFNRGCNYGNNFQVLHGDANGDLVFCGTSGYYEPPSGNLAHDRDWFVVTIGHSGVLDWSLEAEQYTVGYIVYPTDCESAQIVETIEAGICGSGSVVFEGEPGLSVWLLVNPYFFSRPQNFVGHEYGYTCRFSGLQPGVVAAEQRSWSSVKGLFTGPPHGKAEKPIRR